MFPLSDHFFETYCMSSTEESFKTPHKVLRKNKERGLQEIM